jgi:hypothetical protein
LFAVLAAVVTVPPPPPIDVDCVAKVREPESFWGNLLNETPFPPDTPIILLYSNSFEVVYYYIFVYMEL